MNLIPKRYRCFAALGQDKEECLRIRTKDPSLTDPWDDLSLHLGCRDAKPGRIVGTLRLTNAQRMADDPSCVREYRLNLIPKNLLQAAVVVSHPVLLPEHRDGPAPLLLLTNAFEHALNGLGALISLTTCEPNLFPFYRRLGYRPIARVGRSSFGGYRLPLILLLHDDEHLRQQQSPFREVLKKSGFPKRDEAIVWYHKLLDDRRTTDLGFSVLPAEERANVYSYIIRGLSSEGVAAFLHHAVTIRCEAGEAVIRKGEESHIIGIVKKGALEVRKGNRLIAVLGEGDIFGEIAFILNVPRTADVVAAVPETEIVTLSLESIDQLKKTEDRTQIWKNLARVLAQRLAFTNADPTL